MLEEGKVDETDQKKDEIEEHQRERRKELSKMGKEHVPRFFKWAFPPPRSSSMSIYWEQHSLFRKSRDSCGRDVWITNETYWKLREDPGFSSLENPQLWWRDEPTRRREMTTTVLLISPRSSRTPVTGSWERCPVSTTLVVFNKRCRRSQSTLFLQKVKKKFKKTDSWSGFYVNLFENMH